MSYSPNRLGRFGPTGWNALGVPQGPGDGARSTSGSSPKDQRVVVPPRQAYSHSASVGSRYGRPSPWRANRRRRPRRSSSPGRPARHRPGRRSTPGCLQLSSGRCSTWSRLDAIHEAALAARFGGGPVAGRLDEGPELADGDLRLAQIERPGDPDGWLGNSFSWAPGSAGGEPIENSPGGIRTSFMPTDLATRLGGRGRPDRPEVAAGGRRAGPGRRIAGEQGDTPPMAAGRAGGRRQAPVQGLRRTRRWWG